MTVDHSHVRGLMNQLLYPIDGAPDLSDATAARLVDNMVDGRLYSAGVEDLAAAIDLTLRAGALDPQTAEASRRFTEAELLEFLARVARELEARRPWPARRFTKLDVSEWGGFGAAAVVARIERPRHQITGALGYPFDQAPVGDGALPVLLLRLRTGEDVAVVGSVDPRSTSFSLLHRGPEDPAEVVAHFRELAGLRDADVIPL